MKNKSFIEQELEKCIYTNEDGIDVVPFRVVQLYLQKAREELRKKKSLGYYKPEFVVKWSDIEKVMGK